MFKIRSHKQIKHSDWLLKTTWLVLTNQTALFQRLNLFMTSTPEEDEELET